MSERRIRIRIATGGMLVSLLLGFLLGCMYMSEQVETGETDQQRGVETTTIQGEGAQEEMDRESFSAGVLLGVDLSAIEDLYYGKLISEETYDRLKQEFDNYMSNPTRENQEKWYNLYTKEVMKISNSPRLPEFWMPIDG